MAMAMSSQTGTQNKIRTRNFIRRVNRVNMA